DAFNSIAGILNLRNGDSTLEPRSADDIVLGPPRLVGFGPDSFTRVGLSDQPTFPSQLTVTLSHAPTSDTVVMVTSGTPSALTVTNNQVTVPAGQTTAPVLVSGHVQTSMVTHTAQLDSTMMTSHVRVLDVSDVPTLVSITPANASVPTGGTVM